MDYDTTLDIKLTNTINTLKKQGADVNKVDSIYGMGNPYYYRNKLQYPVRYINGKTVMGMFAKSTHDIVQNKECLIQDSITHNVAHSLFKLIKDNRFMGYNEKAGTGDIRNIMVRRGIHTDEIMCVVVINNKKLVSDIRWQDIIEKIAEEYKDIRSFILNVNEQNTNVIFR